MQGMIQDKRTMCRRIAERRGCLGDFAIDDKQDKRDAGRVTSKVVSVKLHQCELY